MQRLARIGLVALVSLCWVAWEVSDSSAQGRSATSRQSKAEPVKFRTKDGVILKGSFYASTAGKEAVPVVLLHDFKESRTVFNGLARALQTPPNDQSPSHAVLTIDLRGHGESTTVEGRNGQTQELETARLGKRDFQNMVLQDMEQVRKFLVKKNDSGELNLNKLCLVGCGMGANVATIWAAKDWDMAPLASRKQGQDVKGLVLISPDWGYRGLPLLKSLRQPGVQKKVAMMIVYGEGDKKATKSSMTVHKNLAKYHPDPPPEEGPEAKELFLISLPTSLQGTPLIVDPNFRVYPRLQFFINARLVQQDFEWIQRRSSN